MARPITSASPLLATTPSRFLYTVRMHHNSATVLLPDYGTRPTECQGSSVADRIWTFLHGSGSDLIVRIRPTKKCYKSKHKSNKLKRYFLKTLHFLKYNQQILSKKQKIVNKNKTIWILTKQIRNKKLKKERKFPVPVLIKINIKFFLLRIRIQSRTKVIKILNTARETGVRR